LEGSKRHFHGIASELLKINRANLDKLCGYGRWKPRFLYPITLKVESIDEEDAANDIEITLDGFRQGTVTIELDETQANDLAIQIGQVLQDRANQRTEQAIMITP
jgi:hypothetical protein